MPGRPAVHHNGEAFAARAAALACAPAAYLVTSLLDSPFWRHLPLVALGLVLGGALLLGRWTRMAQLTLTGAIAVVVVSGVRLLVGRPSLALLTSIVSLTLGILIWRRVPSYRGTTDRSRVLVLAARWTSAVALITWFVMMLAPSGGHWAAAAALTICYVYLLRWLWFAERPGWLAFLIVGALVSGIAGATAALPDWPIALSAAGLGPLAALVLLRPDGDAQSIWLSSLLDQPARLVVVTFIVLSVIGFLALILPQSSRSAESLSLLDAAFTAVSAVCVTGLIVVDTPTVFSAFGQASILVLIQVGGLGIMSFYAVMLRALGQRLTLRHEFAVAAAVSVEDRGRLFGFLRQILTITFITEGLGALILFARLALRGEETVMNAAWRAVFTAVSAFCNAGFALQTDSLIPYQRDPIILHTVGLLIIVGGLSPFVVVSLPAWLRRRPVSVQVKLATSASILLLGLAFLAFLSFEWSRTLAAMSLWDRLNNAWFQSVTLRTAGFNSVDIAATGPATQTLMISMMYIGGSPGGTAGGIKVTTAAVLFLAVVAALRGREDISIFGRHIGHASAYKAAAVATLGVVVATVAVLVMLLTQEMPESMAFFEVISALGTVGLSTGGTARLDEVGKVVIILCMFMGRVGPLTLFLFLSETRRAAVWQYPREEVDVG